MSTEESELQTDPSAARWKWKLAQGRGDEFSEDYHGWVSLPLGDSRHLEGNELKVLNEVTWQQHFANKVDKFKAQHNRDLRYTKGISALTYDCGFKSRGTTKRAVLGLEAKGYVKVEKRDHSAWIIDVTHAPSYGIFNPDFAYPERAPRAKTTDKPLQVDEHGEILPRQSPQRKCAGTTKLDKPCSRYVRQGDYCESHWEQAPTPLVQESNKQLVHESNKHSEHACSPIAQAVQVVQEVVVGSTASVQAEQLNEIHRLQKCLKLNNATMAARIREIVGAVVARSSDLTEAQAEKVIAKLRIAEHNTEKLSHLEGWGALAR